MNITIELILLNALRAVIQGKECKSDYLVLKYFNKLFNKLQTLNIKSQIKKLNIQKSTKLIKIKY